VDGRDKPGHDGGNDAPDQMPINPSLRHGIRQRLEHPVLRGDQSPSSAPFRKVGRVLQRSNSCFISGVSPTARSALTMAAMRGRCRVHCLHQSLI
jgi:hypothetical protein